MKKILHYITYQTFPADTANSLQTISNLKYFVKNNYEVNLYFPLREKNSSKELETIQNKYNFNEIINPSTKKNDLKHNFRYTGLILNDLGDEINTITDNIKIFKKAR